MTISPNGKNIDAARLRLRFGKRLKEARENAGLNQTQLCKALGLSQSNYYKYEQGLQAPTLAVAYRLAKLFNLTLDEMLEERT